MCKKLLAKFGHFVGVAAFGGRIWDGWTKKIRCIAILAIVTLSMVMPIILIRPEKVYSQDMLENVYFGFPFPFIIQEQPVDLPSYPAYRSLCIPLECPTKLILHNYFANMLLSFILLSSILRLLIKFIQICKWKVK